MQVCRWAVMASAAAVNLFVLPAMEGDFQTGLARIICMLGSVRVTV